MGTYSVDGNVLGEVKEAFDWLKRTSPGAGIIGDDVAATLVLAAEVRAASQLMEKVLDEKLGELVREVGFISK